MSEPSGKPKDGPGEKSPSAGAQTQPAAVVRPPLGRKAPRLPSRHPCPVFCADICGKQVSSHWRCASGRPATRVADGVTHRWQQESRRRVKEFRPATRVADGVTHRWQQESRRRVKEFRPATRVVLEARLRHDEDMTHLWEREWRQRAGEGYRPDRRQGLIPLARRFAWPGPRARRGSAPAHPARPRPGPPRCGRRSRARRPPSCCRARPGGTR